MVGKLEVIMPTSGTALDDKIADFVSYGDPNHIFQKQNRLEEKILNWIQRADGLADGLALLRAKESLERYQILLEDADKVSKSNLTKNGKFFKFTSGILASVVGFAILHRQHSPTERTLGLVVFFAGIGLLAFEGVNAVRDLGPPETIGQMKPAYLTTILLANVEMRIEQLGKKFSETKSRSPRRGPSSPSRGPSMV